MSPRVYAFAHVAVAAEVALPELQPSDLPVRYRVASVSVLSPAPRVDARHDWRDTAGTITLTLLRCGAVHRLVAPGLVAARIDGRDVAVCANPAAGTLAPRHTLLNQILPRVLDRDGELMLHAAMLVDVGKPAILVLGNTCYGKSTLAAAFAQADGISMSDDGVRIGLGGGVVHATPTYPSLRLRPDSHAALRGDALPVRAWQAGPGAPNALGVGAIVVLNTPGADAGITLQPSTHGETVMALVQNSFALDPNDLRRAQERLAQAASVANAVPAYRLGYPRDYARLPEVVACLRALAL